MSRHPNPFTKAVEQLRQAIRASEVGRFEAAGNREPVRLSVGAPTAGAHLSNAGSELYDAGEDSSVSDQEGALS